MEHQLAALRAFCSTPAAAIQSLFGFRPMFVVFTGNGIDSLSSGANYGRYDTHHLASQDDMCRGGCFASAVGAKWTSEALGRPLAF